MIVTNVKDRKFFTAVDGCEIAELIGAPTTGTRDVSLAYALIRPGFKTYRHYHNFTEIYMIARGEGVMYMNAESRVVKEGDNVLIPPKSRHCIENRSDKDLVIWCICSPAFTPDETEVQLPKR